jgi:hypothetical protein
MNDKIMNGEQILRWLRAIVRARCFLVGHEVFEPTCGVQACRLCNENRDWSGPDFTTREFHGIARWPIYFLRRDWFQALKAFFFCEECGRLLAPGKELQSVAEVAR